MTRKQILLVQILEYDTKETELPPKDMAEYVKEKLSQMHDSINKDGQPIRVLFSQTRVCVFDNEFFMWE